MENVTITYPNTTTITIEEETITFSPAWKKAIKDIILETLQEEKSIHGRKITQKQALKDLPPKEKWDKFSKETNKKFKTKP